MDGCSGCEKDRRIRVDSNRRPFSTSLCRRRLLHIGSLGSLGLSLPRLLRADADATRAATSTGALKLPRPIRSCILIFHYGGPSHIDMFDIKPNAPVEIRGQFSSIATKVPGLRVCEHLPDTAKVMNRVAVIRSMHHPMTNHNAAAFPVLCGRNPLKGDLELLSNDRNDPPCFARNSELNAAQKTGTSHVRGPTSRNVQRRATSRSGCGFSWFGT